MMLLGTYPEHKTNLSIQFVDKNTLMKLCRYIEMRLLRDVAYSYQKSSYSKQYFALLRNVNRRTNKQATWQRKAGHKLQGYMFLRTTEFRIFPGLNSNLLGSV